MILLLGNMVLTAIYMIIPGYYRIHILVINVRLVYKIIYMNLSFSVSCYLNASFIHSTILDCLTAFQVINEKETLIINKLFCFKTNMS